MTLKSNLAARVGKVLFSSGIAGCLLLGLASDTGGSAKLPVALFLGVAGAGALMIGGFAADGDFQGARLLPKAIPFARVVFMLLGGSLLLFSLLLAAESILHA